MLHQFGAIHLCCIAVIVAVIKQCTSAIDIDRTLCSMSGCYGILMAIDSSLAGFYLVEEHLRTFHLDAVFFVVIF